MSTVHLASARYGKDKVRVFRIVRQEKEGQKWHEVVEYNVRVLLEGEIETSYTKADNGVVVATDSMKNITYYMAKVSPHVLVPELFAMHLGAFIVGKYAHIQKAFVDVEQLKWARIDVGAEGQPRSHGHSFWRDGDEKRTASVEIDATAGKDKMTAEVTSGVADLLVLKSSGSAFEGFVRDEFTTLPEVSDRIFSTAVDLKYVYECLQVPASLKSADPPEAVDLGPKFDFGKVAKGARDITLQVFATDESASVQATLYKMAEQILGVNPGVTLVQYALPNKHYIPVDMKYLGIDNLTPSEASVFCPVSAPSGLITASVARS